MRLDGQVVIVTGAGAGIGKGIAREVAREGARVVVATLVVEEGEATEAELRAAGGEACFIQTDVAVEESIRGMVEATLARYSRIDALVNNAGITRVFALLDATVEQWDELMDINLRGPFLCAKHVAPTMMAQGRGSIINIASNHAVATLPHFEVYAASKAGITGLTRGLALSLGAYNIRVNAVCPGFTETEAYFGYMGQGEEFVERERALKAIQPLGRIGRPDDIGKLVVYLASDESRMMTGSTLLIDGGLSTALYNRTGYS